MCRRDNTRLTRMAPMIELVKLGKRLSTRQQALATAQVYVRRFYTRVEIRRTNPYLVLATAFYLACKMEECPQHIRFVVNEAHTLWPGMDSERPIYGAGGSGTKLTSHRQTSSPAGTMCPSWVSANFGSSAR